eukprot:216922-Pleurochrysis_carterae.AAC.1
MKGSIAKGREAGPGTVSRHEGKEKGRALDLEKVGNETELEIEPARAQAHAGVGEDKGESEGQRSREGGRVGREGARQKLRWRPWKIGHHGGSVSEQEQQGSKACSQAEGGTRVYACSP